MFAPTCGDQHGAIRARRCVNVSLAAPERHREAADFTLKTLLHCRTQIKRTTDAAASSPSAWAVHGVIW
jgi:hypothetical protein